MYCVKYLTADIYTFLTTVRPIVTDIDDNMSEAWGIHIDDYKESQRYFVGAFGCNQKDFGWIPRGGQKGFKKFFQVTNHNVMVFFVGVTKQIKDFRIGQQNLVSFFGAAKIIWKVFWAANHNLVRFLLMGRWTIFWVSFLGLSWGTAAFQWEHRLPLDTSRPVADNHYSYPTTAKYHLMLPILQRNQTNRQINIW